LSQGEIEGLDKNCTVGLGGVFYTRQTAKTQLKQPPSPRRTTETQK
jgi:hypothetical protein